MNERVLAPHEKAALAPGAFDTRAGLPAPKGRFWLGDFEFSRDGVLIKKTGWRAPYSLSNILSVRMWLVFFLTVKAMAPIARPSFTIYFAPDRVRPWYLIWCVAKVAGGRIVTAPDGADVVMHFEDATYGDASAPIAQKHRAFINFGCRDVSKSAVARAFEAAFGYSLALDPRAHQGEAVEKSELNGAHNGRIVACPAEPKDGLVYQRVIDNRADEDGLVEDFRTPTVGGEPVCVFIKHRRASERFANANTDCTLARVEDCFSREEIARIREFCARMHLDWGGLDILRDRGDGRLYIVDANKTDMGPPIALPLRDKIKATKIMARAFRALVERG